MGKLEELDTTCIVYCLVESLYKKKKTYKGKPIKELRTNIMPLVSPFKNPNGGKLGDMTFTFIDTTSLKTLHEKPYWKNSS